MCDKTSVHMNCGENLANNGGAVMGHALRAFANADNS